MRRAIRRFSIPDAMILIAAAAIGIVAVRALLSAMRTLQIGFGTCTIWLILASPVVGMWCLALLVVALARREARRRRLFRMPGLTASATYGIVLVGDNWGWIRLNPGVFTSPSPGAIYILWDQATSVAGLAIIAVWTAQALSGCWRPAPSWIDRAGRLAGLFWIAAYMIHQLNI